MVASPCPLDRLDTRSGANSLISPTTLLQNSKGYVSWLDVSIGEKVSGFQTHRGRLGVMTQNPANAILHLAHSRGIIPSDWLFKTQSRILLADWLIFENDEKATLHVDMPYLCALKY